MYFFALFLLSLCELMAAAGSLLDHTLVPLFPLAIPPRDALKIDVFLLDVFRRVEGLGFLPDLRRICRSLLPPR